MNLVFALENTQPRCAVTYFSEGDDDVRYYSTPLQLENLIETLDSEKYEKDLVTSLVEMKDEIVRQMTVTEELTKENQGSRKSALETVNGLLYLSLVASFFRRILSALEAMFHVFFLKSVCT